MEIAKEKYFDVKYNKSKDILEVGKGKNIFKRHKFITGVLFATSLLIIINLFLIYKFFEILFAFAS